MGQLERYGLYVLVVVIFLILGVAIWGDPESVEETSALAATGNTALRNADAQERPSEKFDHVIGQIGDMSAFNDVPTTRSRDDHAARSTEGMIDPADEPLDTIKVGVDDASGIRREPVEPIDPRVTPTPAPVAVPATYVIQAGDSLARISRKMFGTEAHAGEIQRLNGITDPTKLKIGRSLRLPTIDGSVTTTPQPGGGGAVAGSTYVVELGDSPAGISKKLFGTEAHAKAIMALNGISDPHTMKVGQTLRLPDVSRDTATNDAAAGESYTVVAGDSFARISRKVFGSERHARAIMALNGIDNPLRLRPGQTLRLPAVDGE